MRRAFLAFSLALAPISAQAAITYVSPDGTYVFSTTTSVALNKPAGVASGDLEIMCTSIHSDSATIADSTPAGWTAITDTGAHSDGGTPLFNRTYAFYKIAGGSEPSTYTVSESATGTFTWMDGVIRDYRGTATSSPINLSNTGFAATNTTTVASGTLAGETWVSGEWFVGCATSETNDVPTSASPTLSNVVTTAGSVEGYEMGDLIPGSAPGTETYTYSTGVQGRLAIGMTIKPAGAAAASNGPSLLLFGVGRRR